MDGQRLNLGDEKTLADHGVSGTSSTYFLTVDSNPIILRVNLSHSMHQSKPSGSGTGYNSKGAIDLSGCSGGGFTLGNSIDEIVDV